MYPSSNMNNFPFANIPSIWFVSRREHLETHYQELLSLSGKVAKLARGQNPIAVLRMAESLDQLNEQILGMEETFESNLTPFINEYDPYNKNDLRRIRELALSTSSNLRTIASQISWGRNTDKQMLQVKRNLYPLLELVNHILKWLERGI